MIDGRVVVVGLLYNTGQRDDDELACGLASWKSAGLCDLTLK